MFKKRFMIYTKIFKMSRISEKDSGGCFYEVNNTDKKYAQPGTGFCKHVCQLIFLRLRAMLDYKSLTINVAQVFVVTRKVATFESAKNIVRQKSSRQDVQRLLKFYWHHL